MICREGSGYQAMKLKLGACGVARCESLRLVPVLVALLGPVLHQPRVRTAEHLRPRG